MAETAAAVAAMDLDASAPTTAVAEEGTSSDEGKLLKTSYRSLLKRLKKAATCPKLGPMTKADLRQTVQALSSLHADIEQAEKLVADARAERRAAAEACIKAGVRLEDLSHVTTLTRTTGTAIARVFTALKTERAASGELSNLLRQANCRTEKQALLMLLATNRELKDSRQQLHDLSEDFKDREQKLQARTLDAMDARDEARNEAAVLQQQLAEASDQLVRQEGVSAALEQVSGEGAQRKRQLIAAMAKPRVFDGKNTSVHQGRGSVRDWLASVKRYASSAGFSDAETVSLAASFLQDDAARTWDLRVSVLEKQQISISMEDFCACMVQRFEPATAEATARTALDALKQKGRHFRLTAYLAEFERLCTYVPDMTAGDKVHRFTAGLVTDAYKRHLAVDPKTHTRYTSFDELRCAAESLAAAAPDLLKAADEGFGNLKGLLKGSGVTGWQKAGSKRGSPGTPAAPGAGSSGSSKKPKGSASSLPWEEKKAIMASRSVADQAVCKKRGLCLVCFGKGHRAAECTASKAATGSPPTA